MNITALGLNHKQLGELVKSSSGDVCIDDCLGQRFIGCAEKSKKITINGVPGNALGAYLDGAVIEVNGNVQDAVGDTMNDGKIIVHGNAGDALGYAMRGGSIFVKGDSGYRTGIHMKEYKNKKPVIVIGGSVGSFLGEYQAGGLIVVMGLATTEMPVGNFTGTGIHGGSIFIRTKKEPTNLPSQVQLSVAKAGDLTEIEPYVSEFAELFGFDAKALLTDNFYVLTPSARNPYKQLYTLH